MSISDELKLSRSLIMTPQLQMAINMLATPAGELQAMVDKFAADHPGSIVDGDLLEGDESLPSPFPPATEPADVFVVGNPPEVYANRDAIPRFGLAPGVDADTVREAQWLARALQQRAKTCQKVVAYALSQRPNIAIAMTLDDVDPVPPRAIAEAIGMHESTITRVASACRFQNLHGVFALAPIVSRRRRSARSPAPGRARGTRGSRGSRPRRRR